MTAIRDRSAPATPATSVTLLTVEQARDQVLAAIPAPLEAESVAVAEARGRVLAEPVRSRTALPPWDNSAMDGYAIRSADVAAATDEAPVRLTVIGEVRAGSPPDVSVKPGSAVRIATGAPLPPGADSVVPVEATTPLAADGSVAGPRGRDATGPLPAGCLVHAAVRAGDSVRRRGSDLAGDVTILEANTEMTPAAIALAAIIPMAFAGRPAEPSPGAQRPAG